MRTFRLNKLVRDGILSDMQANNQNPVYKRLKGDELVSALGEKVVEEAAELVQPDADVSEAADVITAARAWAAAKGVSEAELEQLIAQKNADRGAFADGIYIETVSVSDDDPRIAYYEQNSDRYPEVKER